MTITVAVTGGIGAGKSTVSALLAARGAVVIDSDRLAREVVGMGTPGLAAVAEQFGRGVLSVDGSLDRAALASIVFRDAVARRQLEAITHPLVRSRFAQLQAAAPAGSVVVNDIPLLTTTAAAAAFHLVIGVGATETVRVERLLRRGLTADDARARIATQIDDAERRLLCDGWIANSGSPVDVRRRTDLLWSRLARYAANVQARRPASRGAQVVVPNDPEWSVVASRAMARVRHAVGDCRVDHIGATAIPALPAQPVIDLQLAVADPAQAEVFAPLLIAVGLPRFATPDADSSCSPSTGVGVVERAPLTDTDTDPDTGVRRERVHVNADPGQNINLYLRLRSAPNWARSLRIRDWLRADPAGRVAYLTGQQARTGPHGADRRVAGYAQAEERFLAEADLCSRAWATATGWQPI